MGIRDLPRQIRRHRRPHELLEPKNDLGRPGFLSETQPQYLERRILKWTRQLSVAG